MNRLTTALAFVFAGFVAMGTASADQNCQPRSKNGCTQTCKDNVGTVICQNSAATGMVRSCHTVDYNVSPPSSKNVNCPDVASGVRPTDKAKVKAASRRKAPLRKVSPR